MVFEKLESALRDPTGMKRKKAMETYSKFGQVVTDSDGNEKRVVFYSYLHPDDIEILAGGDEVLIKTLDGGSIRFPLKDMRSGVIEQPMIPLKVSKKENLRIHKDGFMMNVLKSNETGFGSRFIKELPEGGKNANT